MKNVSVLLKKNSPWTDFLKEFFDDTSAAVYWVKNLQDAGPGIDKGLANILLIEPELLTLGLAQKLKVRKQTSPDDRIFQLGTHHAKIDAPVDAVFEHPESLLEFQKKLVDHLPLPQTIRLLVADDETEIGKMILEFFERRVNPSFDVEYVENGAKALASIERKMPDVLVLDIKMPQKDGREVYREIRQKKLPLPVIIFFDSISGDEMVEIHKYGHPAVVEKGARQSALPELMSLVKKMAYFG